MAQVAVEFWRAAKAANGPGKVHVCINRVPIDDMWTAEQWLARTDLVQVGWAEFLASPCGVNPDDGHVGPNGCVSRLNEVLAA